VLLVIVADSPFGYIGPDVILPFASVLTGIVGVVLIFWRFIVKTFKKMIRAILHGPSAARPVVRTEVAPAGAAPAKTTSPASPDHAAMPAPLSEVGKP
jgi:hypothetical protein